jgi:hypothetical protein
MWLGKLGLGLQARGLNAYNGANLAAQQDIPVRLGLIPQPVDMAPALDNGFSQYAATQVP